MNHPLDEPSDHNRAGKRTQSHHDKNGNVQIGPRTSSMSGQPTCQEKEHKIKGHDPVDEIRTSRCTHEGKGRADTEHYLDDGDNGSHQRLPKTASA